MVPVKKLDTKEAGDERRFAAILFLLNGFLKRRERDRGIQLEREPLNVSGGKAAP
jgi:hypothetical protein